MAAIAPSLALALLLFWATPQDVDRQVGDVANALAGGNPAAAMTPFDKSFAGYDTLSNDFVALTNSYQITSQIEITDRKIEGTEATLTANWTLTLTDPDTSSSQTRSQDVTVKLALKGKNWRIVDFTPLSFFDPQAPPEQKERQHRSHNSR